MTADPWISLGAGMTGTSAPAREPRRARASVPIECAVDEVKPPRLRAALPVYERVLPARSTSVSQIRCELDDALGCLNVDPARRADIALVVSEAGANVVMHAYVDMPPGPLEVRAVALG